MTNLALVGLAGAALLVAGPAFATQGDPTPSSTVSGVTVTAENPDPLADKTTEFVRERLPTSRNEQYARFRDDICVKVLGLTPEFNAFVARRVVEIARQVHAPVAASP